MAALHYRAARLRPIVLPGNGDGLALASIGKADEGVQERDKLQMLGITTPDVSHRPRSTPVVL